MRGKFPICLGERFAPTRAFAAFFGKVAFDLLNNYIRVEHLAQVSFNSVLLNLYRNGSDGGVHSKVVGGVKVRARGASA